MDEESTTLPQLDRESSSPIWFQIMRALEIGISTGRWRQGERLPSEHQLCEHFQVSRTSIRQALQHLADQGLIVRHQGSGAYVDGAGDPWAWALPDTPSLLGQYRDGTRSALTSQVLRAEVVSLPAWAAAAYPDSSDGTGLLIERLRSVGQLMAVHVLNYLPRRFTGILPNLRDPRASLYATLESVAHIRVSRMRRTIEAISADRRMASLLEVEEGYPLVVVEAVAYDGEGNIVDVSRAAVRTDRLQVTVDSSDEGQNKATTLSGTYPGLDVALAELDDRTKPRELLQEGT